MYLRRVFILTYCFFISVYTFSQKDIDYKFGSITAKDFDISNAKIVDTNVSAVVLYEAGSTHFVGNSKGWFSYVYTCNRRIKILNKRAFAVATVEIPIYKGNEDAEILSDFKAVTYNLNNGAISSVNLNKEDVFTGQEDKNHILKKFTMPAVQEGSIIEYTYTITSPYLFNIPSWLFQNLEYPVLWSEYKVSIPSALTYVSFRQGFDSFYIKKNSETQEFYQIKQSANQSEFLGSQDRNYSVGALTYKCRWVMKDVKPLQAESYVSSPLNYIDKIDFQLSAISNGHESNNVGNTWQNACKDFFNSNDFQQAALKNNTWIKEVPSNEGVLNYLDVAKNIYYYIQENYTCINTINVFKEADLFDVYKKREGSVRGLNLLLIAMLNSKNINAEPVLLSTKENGFINADYPDVNKFNYLVCRAFIDGKPYLLDASNTVIGFGDLPEKCYNGYARVLNESHPDSLYLMPGSLQEISYSTLFLNNGENGTVTGSYKVIMGKMQSALLRQQMLGINKNDYFKEVQKQYAFEVKISNAAIDSLQQKEIPVSVEYDLLFKPEGDIIYFTPMIHDAESVNPFKAAVRSYPVEMPYCFDKTYVLTMQVPEGYKTDELPKSQRMFLNENEGMFEYLIQQNGNNIQLRCHLKINKAIFQPEDYETLRKFFAVVVEKENAQIVFKKL